MIFIIIYALGWITCAILLMRTQKDADATYGGICFLNGAFWPVWAIGWLLSKTARR